MILRTTNCLVIEFRTNSIMSYGMDSQVWALEKQHWKFVKNANSQAHSRHTASEILGAGPCNLCVKSSILMHAKV